METGGTPPPPGRAPSSSLLTLPLVVPDGRWLAAGQQPNPGSGGGAPRRRSAPLPDWFGCWWLLQGVDSILNILVGWWWWGKKV